MNIAQAKAMPLTKILEKLGYTPIKKYKDGTEWRYFSPLRDEKTPSFDVNIRKNVWFDHGSGQKGNTLNFAIAYLKMRFLPFAIKDALAWLDSLSVQYPLVPVKESAAQKEPFSMKLVSIGELKSKPLFNYLSKRGISEDVAQKYLKQIVMRYTKSNRVMTFLAFENDNGGYEMRGTGKTDIKSCYRKKTYTCIRGTKLPSTRKVRIYEGFIDFLSALMLANIDAFEDDVIVLNSVSMTKKVCDYVIEAFYDEVHLWLDNDKAGKEALDVVSEHYKGSKMRVFNHSPSFYPHKDVNDFLRFKRGMK